jgi:hypothetical protein
MKRGESTSHRRKPDGLECCNMSSAFLADGNAPQRPKFAYFPFGKVRAGRPLSYHNLDAGSGTVGFTKLFLTPLGVLTRLKPGSCFRKSRHWVRVAPASAIGYNRRWPLFVSQPSERHHEARGMLPCQCVAFERGVQGSYPSHRRAKGPPPRPRAEQPGQLRRQQRKPAPCGCPTGKGAL